MRRSLRSKGLGRICVSVAETTMKDAIKAVKEAKRLADLIELRVDYLRQPRLEPLLNRGQKPFIVTCRRKEEGGKYEGDERERLRILEDAVDLGVNYIDLEAGIERSLLQGFIRSKKKGAQIILSHHDFKGTPSQKELRALFDDMIRFGPEVVKIVTFARSWEDNLDVLSLIPYARERRQEIVTFCMGEKGKMSRIFAPFFGAVWTYASLSNGRASAPGQLTVWEMKDIWERLR